MPIAATTRIAMTSRAGTEENTSRRACPRLMRVARPSRPDISCKTMVAKIEKTTAQARTNPCSAPVTMEVVMVPGPMKDAAMISPGPKRLGLSSWGNTSLENRPSLACAAIASPPSPGRMGQDEAYARCDTHHSGPGLFHPI